MSLNLPVVDRRTVGGIGGAHEVNMHLAHIHIPSLASTIYGLFAGVGLQAGGQRHQALIGRTFLQGFTMIYEGRTGTPLISENVCNRTLKTAQHCVVLLRHPRAAHWPICPGDTPMVMALGTSPCSTSSGRDANWAT